jgi:ABC-type lipoprotein release transport system permease subunit
MTLTFLNLVVVSGLLVGLLTGSFQQFRAAYSGDILVTPKPGRAYMEDSSSLVGFIAAQPEVVSYSPRYSVTGSVLGTLDDNPKQNEKTNSAGAGIVGFDPVREEQVTRFSRFVIKGQPLVKGDDGYVLIGANLIKEYSSFADVDIPGVDLLRNIRIGQKVRVSVSVGDRVATKDYVVKGIVKSKVDQISQRMFVVDSDLRRLLPVNQWELQEVAIRTQSGTDARVDQRLKDFVGNRPIRVQTSAEAIPTFLRQIEQTFNILGNALSSIALVVASITIFIVIFINAVTRRKFIGIMKGIGIEPRAIQAAYVFQAIFYGVVGSAIGLLLTFGFLRPYFDANPINFPFSDGILAATWSGSFLREGRMLLVALMSNTTSVLFEAMLTCELLLELITDEEDEPLPVSASSAASSSSAKSCAIPPHSSRPSISV